MAIREDLVASAAKFLQDPSVATSPIEKKIAFLQAKNLSQEEVSAALARAGPEGASVHAQTPQTASAVAQPPPYYGQYPPQYPPYGWQQPPPQAAPRRDWRDWFIMATVVSGVSYGLFSLGKRYVYPLIAPPTPERLEQDKKSIDDKFEQTFALVEQLAKDTEALKAAEKERTEKLDTALGELETVINELKSANRRREDEAQRTRDDVQNLKDSLPRALSSQKDLTDTRLREVNAELKSLKTLITQRMNPAATATTSAAAAGTGTTSSTFGIGGNHHLRPASVNGQHAAPTSPAAAAAATTTPSPAPAVENGSAEAKEQAKPAATRHDYLSNGNRSSPFSSGMQSKASIPAWQLMAANKGGSSSSSGPSTPAAVNGSEAGAGGEAQEGVGSA